MRVLVLDDNTMQRQLLALYLREWGFDPLPVETLDEALRTARLKQIDAVVCDVLMPKHDGFSCCRQMRAEPSFVRPPNRARLRGDPRRRRLGRRARSRRERQCSWASQVSGAYAKRSAEP